ncbi:MAG TPA: M28 family peptidase [Rhodothermales bacterium]|nr:M28 family peptidase [Rhodothermales bacterium]
MNSRIPARLYSYVLAAALLLGTASPCLAQSAAPAKTPTLFESPELVEQYQQTITPEDLASHLYFFASDFFEGRETGMPGQKLAARYLAAQYRKIGLEPKGTAQADGPYAPQAYLQPFTVYGTRLKEARLAALSGGDTLASARFALDHPSDTAYLLQGSKPQASGAVVFLGYGIADDDLGYNDYAAAQAAGIDLTGKWLLILADEPLSGPETSLLHTPDGRPSRWSEGYREKLYTALDTAKPAGVLIVGDTSPRTTDDIATQSARLAAGLQKVAGPLSLDRDNIRAGRGLPVYVVSTALADKLLAPSGRTVGALQQAINTSLKPIVLPLQDVSVDSRIDRPVTPFQTANVAAMVEGTDPVLKHEVVVVGSHYDHIGIDPFESGDQINNGADDDGSGTVTTLEIAEAFQKAKEAGYGPRRSILFLNVAGEEKGLLGSEFYTDHQPIVPLENTVTDLNIDMIGRYDPTRPGGHDYVYVIGSKLISKDLDDIIERANTVTDLNLTLDDRFNTKDDPNRFYARSDHWNFGKHGIPFAFFFTGTHEDYHQVGDEAYKIDYDRMADIAREIFATAWQVANQDARPAVSGTGFN